MVNTYRIILMSSILCVGALFCSGSQNIFEAVKNKDWNYFNNISSLDRAEQSRLVNQRDGFGGTPLFAAAGVGDLQIVKFLVGHGASLEALTYGMSPLINAASIGNTEVVTFLLKAGASVATADDNGLTPLHHAARGGNVDAVRVLITNHADVNARDREHNAPLYGAASRGHYEVAKLLIESGADVKVPNQMGMTPLHNAAQAGRSDLVQYLLRNQADPYVLDNKQRPPLYYALESGNPETVELLMAHTQLTAEEMEKGEFLHCAARKCPEIILRKLVEKGLSSSQCDRRGCTPLHYAAYGCNLPAARYLVHECHADIDLKNRGGDTPVHSSVLASAGELLAFLLNSGGLIDVKSNTGQTPLMAAALAEDEQMVSALLAYGCFIDDSAFEELTGLFQKWFYENLNEQKRDKLPVMRRWKELEYGLSEVILPDVLKVLIMKFTGVCPRELKRRLKYAKPSFADQEIC